MNGYEGTEIGEVIAFVKTTFFQGARVADLSPGLVQDGLFGKDNAGKQALAQLVNQKEQVGSDNVSEIVTDRLTAVLGIMTPNVLTHEVALDSISSSIGQDIAVKLQDTGALKIQNEHGDTGISFDSQGNAVFAGTITANHIRANQIEGLEIFTDKLSRLSIGSPLAAQAVAASDSAHSFTNGLTIDGDFTASGSSRFIGKAMFDAVATFLSDIFVKGNALVEGTLKVLGDITFFGKMTVNGDTAGIAVVPMSATRVDVPFEKPFGSIPIVTISLNLPEATDSAFLADGVRAAVTNVTDHGFTILVDQPVPRDLTYNWLAFAVANGRKVVGKTVEGSSSVSTVLVTPTASILGLQTATPSATITPTPIQPAESAPSAMPTPQLITPSPTPTPSVQTVTVLSNDLGFVRVRDAPNITGEEMGQIPTGTIIPYADVQYGWYRVVFEGITGWISGTYIHVNQ